MPTRIAAVAASCVFFPLGSAVFWIIRRFYIEVGYRQDTSGLLITQGGHWAGGQAPPVNLKTHVNSAVLRARFRARIICPATRCARSAVVDNNHEQQVKE